MPHLIRQLSILLILSASIFLTGCSTSGGRYSSVSYGVYGDYGYPYDRYGYGGCCYNDIDRDDLPNRPDRPDRPERPGKPDGPSILPVPGRPVVSPGRRPSIQPVNRSPGRMGRPSGMSRGRGGGGRRR